MLRSKLNTIQEFSLMTSHQPTVPVKDKTVEMQQFSNFGRAGLHEDLFLQHLVVVSFISVLCESLVFMV